MNALRSNRQKSDLSSWRKFEGTSFTDRFFHKPWETNPNIYPNTTPINNGIENDEEISIPTNPLNLLNIYEVMQICP
jgi:hypothetical protein